MTDRDVVVVTVIPLAPSSHVMNVHNWTEVQRVDFQVEEECDTAPLRFQKHLGECLCHYGTRGMLAGTAPVIMFGTETTVCYLVHPVDFLHIREVDL